MGDVADDLIDAWLTATLRADATLTGLVGQNIYSASAPDELLAGGTLGDAYVVFDFIAGDVEHLALTDPGTVVQTVCRYQVKAVGAGRDSVRLRPLVARVYALHGAAGALDGHLFVAQRAAPVRYLETAPGGHHWWHRGAQFDITVHRL